MANGEIDLARLRVLYKELVENRKSQLDGWHGDYKVLFNEVQERRKQVQEGAPLDAAKDAGLIQKLFKDSTNGIASSGQSLLSQSNLDKLTENLDFMSALNALFAEPSKDNFKKFEHAWDKAREKAANKYGNKFHDNPIIRNRLVAACTTDVSTLVSEWRFTKVFDWLTEEGIIPSYEDGDDDSWFAKNEFLMGNIHRAFEDELRRQETDEFYLSIFIWEIFLNIDNPFRLHQQIVYYGAPGTGKTYKAREEAKLKVDIWKAETLQKKKSNYDEHIELVQFHPSFSYEDFLEGLRPTLGSDGQALLTLQNGVFKSFCQRAGKWEVDYFKLKQSHNGLPDWEDVTIEELADFKKELKARGGHWTYIFEIAKASQKLADTVPPYIFIIDEINRAELSRVLGELMLCLEYRGADGKIKTQYAGLNTEETAMLTVNGAHYFFIPTNIYLIGTMNSIDRSVESFDFALRRRFAWQELKPDYDVLKHHLNHKQEHWVMLEGRLKELNEKIAASSLLGADYVIGQSYLMNLKYSESLTVKEVAKNIWEDSINPLIQEYLRGEDEAKTIIKDLNNTFLKAL